MKLFFTHKEIALKKKRTALVVIGIGGSYLGARAAIEMLKNHFYNVLDNSKRKTPQVFFVGTSSSCHSIGNARRCGNIW